VGAYALAFHARPRYTKDFDVLVDSSPENIRRLLVALDQFGFGNLGLRVHDFEEGKIVQLGMPPNRIDLLTRIDGVTFDEVWSSRVEGKSGDVAMTYIGRDALIRNKRASGRPQDLVDIQLLEKR
jgi:hypothetical protein